MSWKKIVESLFLTIMNVLKKYWIDMKSTKIWINSKDPHKIKGLKNSWKED